MASHLAQQFKNYFYGDDPHPYRIFEQEVDVCLRQQRGVLLDVGCGRDAPLLKQYRGRAERLIGLEVIDYRTDDPDFTLLTGPMSRIPLPDQSVDVMMARAVIEHIQDPEPSLREVHRVLKPGGTFVFLTANFWDYASLIAMAVPNRWHPMIVARTEGRKTEDVFPTAYKLNTRSAIARIAGQSGLEVQRFDYISQYPNYFMFSAPLFLVGTAYEKIITTVPGLAFLQGWILATLRRPAQAGD